MVILSGGNDGAWYRNWLDDSRYNQNKVDNNNDNNNGNGINNGDNDNGKRNNNVVEVLNSCLESEGKC